MDSFTISLYFSLHLATLRNTLVYENAFKICVKMCPVQLLMHLQWNPNLNFGKIA